MTYSTDWRLAGGPARLNAEVKEYIWNALLRDSGVSMVEWPRCTRTYQDTVQSISETWGSMVSDAGFKLMFPRNVRSEQDRRALIQRIVRADSSDPDVRRVFAKARETAAQRQKRIFVVWIASFWWKYIGDNNRTRDEQVGHAQFIVVDLRKKTQVFFDPHGTRTNIFFREMCLIPPMVPGHTNVHYDYAFGDPIQPRLEEDLESDQKGTCGLSSILTLLCARRFNYWHIPRLTAAIAAAVPTRQKAAVLLQGLVYLYHEKIIPMNLRPAALTDEQVASLLGTMFPSQDRCSVYSDKTGKFCGRASCRAGPLLSLCWQHRHYLQAPQNASKKCAAPPR